ncbi:hypothetical protein [Reticulibacter mediterranei]|nr:hypothetical protein [Reticulibacter mediterranei]
MSTLMPTCSDEEVVEWAVHHYFQPAELAEAQRMLETGSSYEEAVAYLAERGHSTLRDSGEAQPPRMVITIPGGTVFIRHPTRPFPHRPVWEGHVSVLAQLAFSPPVIQPIAVPLKAEIGYQRFSLFDAVPEGTGEPRKKLVGKRPRKLRYLEQPIRMGTAKIWKTRPGYTVKDGHLGYVIEALKQDFYEVSLVHLTSNHVMAQVYLTVLDETTHTRIRGWVADVLPLTDWSRGIAAILKEKTGEQKRQAWARQLEELWKRHRVRPYQFSLFVLGEQR